MDKEKFISLVKNKDYQGAIEIYNTEIKSSGNIFDDDIVPVIIDLWNSCDKTLKEKFICSPVCKDHIFLEAIKKNIWNTGIYISDDCGNEYSISDVGSCMFGQFHLEIDIEKIKGTHLVHGDLFDTECEVIAHAVNCVGVMEDGIKEKYPDVYKTYQNTITALQGECLGGELLCKTGDRKYISNLFTQYYYQGYFSFTEEYLKQDFYKQPELNYRCEATRFTNYEATYKSLKKLKRDMMDLGLHSVAFPYKICSDRGGADWRIIETMIESIFNDGYTFIEFRKK